MEREANLGNVDNIKYSGTNSVVTEFAGTIFRIVRVRLLCVKTTIESDVLKCLRWKPSSTPKVVKLTGTINQLLLRQKHQFPSGLCMG